MDSTSDHIALEANDLAIGYQSISIASKIDFRLAPGHLTAIVGVNGIGKSTLLRTLGNVQPKISGTIQLQGRALEHYKPRELAATISLVLTESIVAKNMTVVELVALGRQPYTNWIGTLSKEDKNRVSSALTMLELNGLQEKKCYELSDGQLQRVMIARALAQDTAVILLDEPTTHLDLYHKVKILKLLKSIAYKTNKAVLFTSHEIEMALQLCDKMLVINGKDNPFGEPSELIEQGQFENLFPSDTVSFDPKSRSFRIEK